MSVYVIAQGRIEDPDMLGQYLAKVIPTIQTHGGRILGFDESPEVVEGDVAFPRTVILEFSDRETFRRWYDSPEYQEILPLRLESTPGSLIVVDALPSS